MKIKITLNAAKYNKRKTYKYTSHHNQHENNTIQATPYNQNNTSKTIQAKPYKQNKCSNNQPTTQKQTHIKQSQKGHHTNKYLSLRLYDIMNVTHKLVYFFMGRR